MGYEFNNKTELLNKLRAYTESPDDENIRYKQRIKEELLQCPELLFAIHNKELEGELFNDDGTLNEEGEWDRYFGENANIRPYLFIPDVQTDVSTLICYQTSFRDLPHYNDFEKYARTTFHIFVYATDNTDKETGIARHDLIGAIIKDRINWSHIFGSQCKVVQDTESSTDSNYVVRTVVFENTMFNPGLKTVDGDTAYNNKVGLRKRFK